ncbi:MAG: hypothetical protein LBP31_03090 [Holosporales bacterium]|jgi:hypothetical protein|nr:hypothetical protein [Holosporales bacterium]
MPAVEKLMSNIRISDADLRWLQEKYTEGSETPNMVISFGEEAKSNNAIANLENQIYLYKMHTAFETPTLGLRAQNLHRSGRTIATPFSGVVPKNRCVVDLMSHLHKQSIKTIKVSVFGYTGATPSPEVTETLIFDSCFIIAMEPWSHGDFATFAFTFVKFVWDLTDYDQKDNGSGISKKIGNRSYTFEFDKATGTLA